jgi:Domain of unknown function DUF302
MDAFVHGRVDGEIRGSRWLTVCQLLLPCNVVVRTNPKADGTVLVEAMDPQVLVDVTGEVELRPVADELATKLQAAIDSL